MSYNVEELFRFAETEDGYAVVEYLKKGDPGVTELEIPAEYNGKPVVRISENAAYGAAYIKRVIIPGSVRSILMSAFRYCSSLEEVGFSEGLRFISNFAFANTTLKSVRLPKSLNVLHFMAFAFCGELQHVEFNGAPVFEQAVFSSCPKLSPEAAVMGMVRSVDTTKPFRNNRDLLMMINKRYTDYIDCFRPDVFELLAKNNSFKNCDLRHLLYRVIKENEPELMPIAEQYGMLEDEAIFDKLLSCAIEQKRTELTAYLLELKKRKFGFKGGDDFEL